MGKQIKTNRSKSLNTSIQKTKNVFADLVRSIRIQTYIIYAVFFVILLLLVAFFDKFQLHLYINKYHSPFFDFFFKYATHLGDGIMFGVLGILFFRIKRRMFFVFLTGGFLTLVVTYILKRIVFKGVPRPVEALGAEALHLIDGVKMAHWNSFPSGHTTAAFTIFTILSLYFYKSKLQYLWISLAIIAGLSRVYLSQHFLVDVFVGSYIGILLGFISMALLSNPKRVDQ